jgi:hypothetical protein
MRSKEIQKEIKRRLARQGAPAQVLSEINYLLTTVRSNANEPI